MADILFEIHTLWLQHRCLQKWFEVPAYYDTASLFDVSSTFFLQEPQQIGFDDTSLKDEFLKEPVKLVVLVVKYSQLFLNNVAVIEKKNTSSQLEIDR